MKRLAILAALLCSQPVLACMVVQDVPPHIDRNDADAVDQHFWKQYFDRNPVVVAVEVTELHEYGEFTIADVSPLLFWKSDAKPVEHVFVRNGICSRDLEKGQKYVLFARRVGPLLEHVKVKSEPLLLFEFTGFTNRLRTYLDSLLVVWVQGPTLRQPNPSLERP